MSFPLENSLHIHLIIFPMANYVRILGCFLFRYHDNLLTFYESLGVIKLFKFWIILINKDKNYGQLFNLNLNDVMNIFYNVCM